MLIYGKRKLDFLNGILTIETINGIENQFLCLDSKALALKEECPVMVYVVRKPINSRERPEVINCYNIDLDAKQISKIQAQVSKLVGGDR